LTSNSDLLKELFTVTLQDLVDKIKNGEATAADLGVARGLLKDNDMQARPEADGNMAKLLEGVEQAEDAPAPLQLPTGTGD